MLRRLIDFYSDREFYSRLFSFAVPVGLQNLVTTSLNMIGVMMIGQLGDVPVAAVGLANQIFFLLHLMLFGITSGCAMFTAQMWGRQDVPGIRRVMGLSISLGLAAGLFFTSVAVFAPRFALGLYSKDPEVIALGSQYLRIYGWAFIFYAITLNFSSVLRSIGDVRTPLFVSMSALGLNIILSYLLIFGALGLPRLGVQGAALAAFLSRIAECAAILWITYRRQSPAAGTPRQLFDIDRAFAARVLKPVLPVVLNETLWSLGITTCYAIYARMGTDSLAAMNIASSIENIALVLFRGIAHACAILVGNLIGANQYEDAYRYVVRSLGLGVAGALLVGGGILLLSPAVLSLYKVSPTVIQHARNILTVVALLLWLRSTYTTLFIGMLRAGGDTRFALVLDAGIIWVVGVPMALLGAFVFHFPIHLVYLMVLTEEFTKSALALTRLGTRRWIHNLAEEWERGKA